jgi:copper chaperone CopZ
MKLVHYNVGGLAGTQSKTKVKNALDEIEGVQDISVDLSRGTMDVQYNEPATAEEIERCIKNTGYEILK